ncbi:unnamed protein product [Pleuronectes platessa]|uniref:Uncharacterized protein n=1 Tax=Pleuronectes platessa TaxID=8262 RepID=A0A9N7YIA1_PLEPL|nr:unnamed protein product [Pleuronectes platessa]
MPGGTRCSRHDAGFNGKAEDDFILVRVGGDIRETDISEYRFRRRKGFRDLPLPSSSQRAPEAFPGQMGNVFQPGLAAQETYRPVAWFVCIQQIKSVNSNEHSDSRQRVNMCDLIPVTPPRGSTGRVRAHGCDQRICTFSP